MESKIVRFTVLDDERGLILGRDTGLLEKGQVYEIVDLFDLGELTIRKVGPSALPKTNIGRNASIGNDANHLIRSGIHNITENEYKKLYENETP